MLLEFCWSYYVECSMLLVFHLVILLILLENYNHAPFVQIVTIGDLKPEPAPWHEDPGRRFGESGR